MIVNLTTQLCLAASCQQSVFLFSTVSRRQNFCLTICIYSGRIGCAYYDPVQCKIFVLEDTEERAPYDLMTIRSVSPCRSLTYIRAKNVCHLVLEQASPDIILTSSRAEDDFMDVLRDHSGF